MSKRAYDDCRGILNLAFDKCFRAIKSKDKALVAEVVRVSPGLVLARKLIESRCVELDFPAPYYYEDVEPDFYKQWPGQPLHPPQAAQKERDRHAEVMGAVLTERVIKAMKEPG